MAASQVELRQLLAASLHLATRAGQVIRDVARGGQLHAVDKALDEGHEGTAEEPSQCEDPQTMADRRAQTLIVGSLQQAWPELQIVGEEEGIITSPDDPKDLVQVPSTEHPDLEGKPWPAELAKPVDMQRVTVFVDPLDATREFTRRVYEAVTVLIGICLDGQPVAGVIGQPFKTSRVGEASVDSPGRIIYGAVGLGVYGHDPAPSMPTDAQRLRVAITASRLDGELQAALDALQPDTILRAGGTGNKMLLVLENQADLYLTTGAGTKRWDTAPGEAMFRALKGVVTNRNGEPYDYPFAKHHLLHNTKGVLGTLRPELLPVAVRCAGLDDRTADITKTPSGEPITVAWIRENLQHPKAKACIGFYAPEATAVRTRHSHVVKMVLQTPGMRKETGARTLLLKRCVAKDMTARPAGKLARDVKSYQNEAMFVRDFAQRLADEAHIAVAHPYFTHVEPHDDPLQSRFMTVVESLEDYTQLNDYTFEQACVALGTIAKMHAYFLAHPSLLATAQEHLWPQGGYWDLEKRKYDPTEIPRTPQTFGNMIARFASDEDPFFRSPEVLALGQAYRDLAPVINQRLRATGATVHTVIHGDFKAANCFFPRISAGSVAEMNPTSDDLSGGMALIDWQWTGMGLGVMDVIYMFVTCLRAPVLEREEELLEVYRQQFEMFLHKFGANISYSPEECRHDYDLATADYIRMLLGYAMQNMSPDEMARIANDKSRGIYARDKTTFKWVLQKAISLRHQLETA
ncbi:uncharacterized protein MONBRDRAFT_22257 [Monosiga brevicollis MX1]|uniref:3'(2'),5'-bisphosphate nucleotidase n=1 Tax=Monosiga brevicollis TaxID=81824 RepID=A9UQ15_MONBE|nr:uncharacterized protein MONBRDRAFT_22257 [Monosiga brevicollis MX1]EDQ92968.1 predicted protein [Monosiga brevicollis MX1]|eukprot:XP_001742730.1 hypothetical protein [Monosiga brevicollis MX1]